MWLKCHYTWHLTRGVGFQAPLQQNITYHCVVQWLRSGVWGCLRPVRGFTKTYCEGWAIE